MTDLEKELVEKLAKASWDAIRKFGDGEWPHDSRRQPYCQSTYREVEVLLPIIRSHTQALVAAAYAACAEHQAGDYNGGDYDWGCICGARGHNGLNGETDTWQAHILSLTPADAARELDRRDELVRADTIMRFRKVLDRLDIHGYYSEMQNEFGCDEASLSKLAPVERSNENG